VRSGAQRGVAGAALAAGILLLAPTAQAAVTIGDVDPGSSTSCSGPTAGMVQDVPQTGKTYVIPSDGVITSFSFSGGGGGEGDPTQTKLLVLERLDAGTYRVAAASQTETVLGQFLVTRPTRVPVSAGQTIGSFGFSCYALPADGGGMVRSFTGPEPAVGSTQTFLSPTAGRIVLAATIEPDCDSDGFGDETQDQSIGSCHPRNVSLDANKHKVKKGKKVTLSGQIAEARQTGACAANQTVELQRKKPSASGFTTVAQLQTDAGGAFTTKRKVKKTLEYEARLAETATCGAADSNVEKVKAKTPR
jgi:hypothetical protein